MAVFRRKRVFRDFGDTQFIGSASVISAALVTGSIVFAGSAIGATSSFTGDASGPIVFSGAPINSANMEVSAGGPIVFSGAITALNISTRDASGTIDFSGTARPAALASGAIVFAGGATVGSTFTMDASGAMVFAGTVAGYHLGAVNNQPIVFAGTPGVPNVSGGTVEATVQTAEMTFAGTAAGTSADIVQGVIVSGGTASGDRVGTTRPIYKILISVKPTHDIYITVRINGA